MNALGRRTPTDFSHVEKYPLALLSTITEAERILHFPKTWRTFYDQGREGACVGFASSEMMSILNRVRFDARWLWNEAKTIDDWPDTNPGDDNGTSVRAAMDVLRTQGHRKMWNGTTQPVDLRWGILENRWAITVDEIRTSIANGVPVVMGTNWYSNFDNEHLKNSEYWVGGSGWHNSTVRGGHSFMFNAVSDRRQGFRTPNSWGVDQPAVWFPYDVVEVLLREYGEATLVTDRP